jgi:tetratricopeptide (TPR) repeat protein
MMIVLAAVAAPIAASQLLDEAALALRAGRLQQARDMVEAAVKNGAGGPRLDRLLADLAFAQGDWRRALAGYKVLLAGKPDDALLLQQTGIAALQAGALGEAAVLLEKAVAQPSAGWRAWNARAVAADWQASWTVADKAYARASSLAPTNAQVLNNRGWSLLLRGEWNAALDFLARAATLAPSDRRIAANLDLARSAASASLPSRRPGESAEAYAARLNDAGVVAARSGDRRKAIAAFAQALEASDRWFARAANNLALVESSK